MLDFRSALIFVGLVISSPVYSEWRGNVGFESRLYTYDGVGQFSISANPEGFWENENRDHLLTLELFARWDDRDDGRSNFDIRELKWSGVFDWAEIHAGVGRVFWGVTESVHLVDVINQSDFAESLDGESKLGQPMVSLSTVQDWGVIDVYWLPYFRERTFNSPEGRLSGPIVVSDDAVYESSAEQWHSDFAVRYSNSVGDWDVGASFFQGTNRDPSLQLSVAEDGGIQLTPFYDQVWQVAFDAQATIDAWLWKLEMLAKNDAQDRFWASVAGFEYTFFGIKNSAADLGVLLEYQFDSRDRNLAGLSQNDVFLGGRLTLNDIQDSQLLGGIVTDLDTQESMLLLEGSRRFGASWVATLDARVFSGYDADSSFAHLEKQDQGTLTIEYHF